MTRTCPICTSDDAEPVARFSRNVWKIVSCNECGLVYLQNPPGYQALEEEFAWQTTLKEEHKARLEKMPVGYRLDRATRWRHSLLRPSRQVQYKRWLGGGSLLNVGCAAALDVFPEFKVYGIEISKELATAANRNLAPGGGYCIHGPGADAIWKFEREMFDGILMRSYLEHEEQPIRVLKGAHRCLKSKGKIYVRVPNYGSVNRRITGTNWCGFRYPDHVNYFSLRTLKDLAARTGFSVKLINPLRLPVDDNINALFTKA